MLRTGSSQRAPGPFTTQKAVVYPLQPLFDMELHQLSPQFTTALKRIFRIFDADRDFLLSDEELNLQFRVSPSTSGVRHPGYKAAHQERTSQLSPVGYVTLEGFLHINKEFIERNRPEASWKILSHFGYERSGDDELCMMLDGNGPDRSCRS